MYILGAVSQIGAIALSATILSDLTASVYKFTLFLSAFCIDDR